MGNKRKIIKKGLINLFPDNIEDMIEPFGGSASVSMNTKSNRYFISEIDEYLITLYNIFKTKTSESIIEHIEKRIEEFNLPKERTKRNQYKDKFQLEKYKQSYLNFRNFYNQNKNPLDLYTLMFFSFSQQLRFNSKGEMNMPYGMDCFSESNKEYIRNGVSFFSQSNVFVSKSDFRNIHSKMQEFTTNTFIYLDPPYLNTTATYNENGGWCVEDEKDLYLLCEALNEKGFKFAMSNVFNNKNTSNEMLINWCENNNWNVYEVKGMTYSSCGRGNSKAKEVVITNYDK
jgi:DNA adenine methylase Dam